MVLLILYVFFFFLTLVLNGTFYKWSLDSYYRGEVFDQIMFFILQFGCFVGTIYTAVYAVKQFILLVQ